MPIPKGLQPTAQDRHEFLSPDGMIPFGLPTHEVGIYSSVTAAVVGMRWADYWIGNVGIIIPPPAVKTVPWLPWWVRTSDDKELCIQTWHRCIGHRDTEAYILARWRPGDQKPRIDIENLDLHNPTERDIIFHGWDLLKFENRPGAKGETQEEARQRLRLAIQKLVKRDLKPTRAALSDETFLSVDGIDKLKQRADWGRKDLERLWNEYKLLRSRR